MNIVVVDDSTVVRRLIARRLTLLDGVEVVGEAADEVNALSQIALHGPDVVLLDFSLACGGSGFHVLKELRSQGYTGKVVMVSTHDEYGTACVSAGADGFYDKSSGLETLFEDLQRLATGGPCAYVSQSGAKHHRILQ